MESQSSSSTALQEQTSSYHPVVLEAIRQMVDGLHARYTTAMDRVGSRSWVYADLLRITTHIRNALAGPNPLGEMRALVWSAPSDGVGQIMDTLIGWLERSGR